MSTVFQYLTPGKPGQRLFESFESQDWQLDEGWTVVVGNPQSSDEQAYDGVRSFKLDSTFPQLRKVVTKPFRLAIVWFFDDPLQVGPGNPAPQVLWMNAAGKQLGIGVDFGVSTVNYVYITETATVDSGIPRVAGWNRFAMVVEGVSANFGINSNPAATFPISSAVFKQVDLGCFNLTGTPWGFFDALQLEADKFLHVFNFPEGDVVTLYDAARNVIDQQPVSGGEAQLNMVDVLSPSDCYIRVSTQDGNFRFISDVRSLAAGDSLFFNQLDFGRRPTMLDDRPMENLQDKESNSGKNEAVFFSARETGSVMFAELTQAQRDSLFSWWAWAKPRNVWSLQIERGQAAYCILTEDAGPGDTNVTVDAVDGIRPGMKLLLSAADNLFQETMTVDYVTGKTVFFREPLGLQGSYQAGDYMRPHLFWPFLLSSDTTLGLSVSTLKQGRWSFQHAFREEL